MHLPCRFLDLPDYQLGGNAQLGPGDSRRILNAYGPTGAKAECVVLSLDTRRTSPAPVGNDARLRARIRWGSHSGDNVAEIDCRHGMRLALEASRVTVDLSYEGTTGPEFTVAASIGYGSISHTRPTWTADGQALAAGAFGALIAVPAWADGVAVLQDGSPFAAPANSSVVSQFGDAAGASLIARFAGSSDFQELAPHCEFIGLGNGAANPQLLTAIFRLAL